MRWILLVLMAARVASAEPIVDPKPADHAQNDHARKRLWIGSGIALAVGIGAHLLAAHEHGILDRSHADNDPATWDHHVRRFRAYRAIAIEGYALAVIGGTLGLLVDRSGPASTTTAMAVVRWTR